MTNPTDNCPPTIYDYGAYDVESLEKTYGKSMKSFYDIFILYDLYSL